MQVFNVTQGRTPIVLGQPHGGTYVPDDIAARLNENGAVLADTDWHIHRLFDGLLENVTTVQSNIHRYVIDANRDPHGVSLYPGQNTTTLVPLTDFDGMDIWQTGQAPSKDEVAARKHAFHTPYHTALKGELERVKAIHGFAILLDCHSIRSNIPFLFDGELPIFNTGTNFGKTCAPVLERAVDVVAQSSNMGSVLNARFKGGWTTRHYGQPKDGFHAIQMEISQRAYMDETPPWTYRPVRAAKIRPYLCQMLKNLSAIAQSGALQS